MTQNLQLPLCNHAGLVAQIIKRKTTWRKDSSCQVSGTQLTAMHTVDLSVVCALKKINCFPFYCRQTSWNILQHLLLSVSCSCSLPFTKKQEQFMENSTSGRKEGKNQTTSHFETCNLCVHIHYNIHCLGVGGDVVKCPDLKFCTPTVMNHANSLAVPISTM